MAEIILTETEVRITDENPQRRQWNGEFSPLLHIWKDSAGKWVCNAQPSAGGSFCGRLNSREEALLMGGQFLAASGEINPIFEALFGWLRP